MSVYLKQEQGWESRTIFTAPGSAALRAATKSRSRRSCICGSAPKVIYIEFFVK